MCSRARSFWRFRAAGPKHGAHAGNGQHPGDAPACDDPKPTLRHRTCQKRFHGVPRLVPATLISGFGVPTLRDQQLNWND